MYVLLVATVDRTAQLFGTVVLIQEIMSNLLKVLEMGTDFKIGNSCQRLPHVQIKHKKIQIHNYLRSADLKRAKSECLGLSTAAQDELVRRGTQY